jgi:Cu2+-containing amine oxidase
MSLGGAHNGEERLGDKAMNRIWGDIRYPLRLFLALIASLSLAHTAWSSPMQEVQPGGALTAAERQRAGEIALQSQADAGFLRTRSVRPEDQPRVVSTVLAPRTTDGGRKAVVFIKAGATGAAQVLVDLQSQKTEGWREIPLAAVPITPDDVADALRIASADPKVRELVGPRIDMFTTGTPTEANPRVVEGIRSIGGSRDDACSRDQCVALLFREGTAYISNLAVTVNLTARRVQSATRTNAR